MSFWEDAGVLDEPKTFEGTVAVALTVPQVLAISSISSLISGLETEAISLLSSVMTISNPEDVRDDVSSVNDVVLVVLSLSLSDLQAAKQTTKTSAAKSTAILFISTHR